MAAGAALAAVVAAGALHAVRGARAPNRTHPWLEAGANRSYVSLPVIVKETPHEPDAFTQGLCFDLDGTLYESDGLYRRSQVRRVDVATGRSLKRKANKGEHFGEGLTLVGRSLFQLTWREGIMHEYDVATLALRNSMPQPFRGEGWGLAYDERRKVAYATDGSYHVHVLDPANGWKATRTPLRVADPRLDGGLIEGLNELEMVEGELWANILPLRHHKASPCVARIDVDTGRVIGWLDFSALNKRQSARVRRQPHNLVLNGIAYRRPAGAARPTLLATGKQWDSMFDLDLAGSALGEAHVRAKCDLHIAPVGGRVG